jgi:hypothetical protein
VNPPKASQRELDSVVVNMELTLASIIQGVALFFSDGQRTRRPVAAALGCVSLCRGKLVRDFIFWSRSIIHTLTLIKWPLEFGHNFFYIGWALDEAILFSRLNRPLAKKSRGNKVPLSCQQLAARTASIKREIRASLLRPSDLSTPEFTSTADGLTI